MQRQVILDAIRQLGNHPTAEEVYCFVAKTHPSISKATVYRNLATAAEVGEVLSLGVFDGAMRFDHNTHRHFHFVCDACKKLIDVPSFDFEKQLASLAHLDIKKVELTLRGFCKDCQAQPTK